MDQIFKDFIKKGLPIELVYSIFRYTYLTQSPILLDDIKDYYPTLKNIQEEYKKRHKYFDPEDYMFWLENDIASYANSDRPTNLGMHRKMGNILSRSIFPIEKIYTFLLKMCVNDNMIKRNINIFWGLFNIKERDEFINCYNVANA